MVRPPPSLESLDAENEGLKGVLHRLTWLLGFGAFGVEGCAGGRGIEAGRDGCEQGGRRVMDPVLTGRSSSSRLVGTAGKTRR